MEERAVVYDLFYDEKDVEEEDAVMMRSIPLAMAEVGEKISIQFVAGGRGLQQRLVSMGLNVGSEIEVIGKGAFGPVLITTGDTRLAIGAGMAEKIMVSPLNP